MDCKHARLLLSFTRDRAEFDRPDADGLQEHLGQCRECEGLAASERRLNRAFSQAMLAVPVPAGLKERVLARLPRPWRWPLRRWTLIPAAIAACLLIGLGLGWNRLFPRPVALDVYADHKIFATAPASPEGVEAWFQERKIAMKFPPNFNPACLDSISIAYHQGKPAAKMFFVNMQDGHIADHAHVLCLKEGDFNAEEKVESSLPVSYKVERRGDFWYVIIYMGALEKLQGSQNIGVPR